MYMSLPLSLPSLAPLLAHGDALAKLLNKAKSKEQENIISNQVDNIIKTLLQSFNYVQSSPHFPKEATVRFLNTIQDILKEFIKFDDQGKSTYEDLVTKVNDLETQWQSGSLSVGDTPCQSSTFIYSLEYLERLPDAYRSLTPEQKQCLLCFLAFPASAEVKKRELTHLWIGLGLVTESSTVNQMLGKLLEKDFIRRVIRNKRQLSRYTMSDSVRSKILTLQASSSSENRSPGGSWSMMHITPGAAGSQSWVRSVDSLDRNTADQDETIQALLNLNENSLDDETFESILKMRNVSVLCLGNWQNEPNKYIVAEDMEGLGKLKNLAHVKVLSLEGVTGLVKLPGLVCDLTNLKVLDLRACPNLELLPEGIGSLANLTHLDLSECYLLDHIPKSITSLTCLQVLKGFLFIAYQSNDSICRLDDLKALKQLRKLTVRSRKRSLINDVMDFQALDRSSKLDSLGVTWVGVEQHGVSRSRFNSTQTRQISKYPWEGYSLKLKKLKLQAPPSYFKLGNGDKNVEKLSITGGGFPDVIRPLHNVKVIRLRHLHNLNITWHEFITLFPNLVRLEVFDCPGLGDFPCDNDGIWTKTTVRDT